MMYLLAFSRVAIGLVFAISSFSKTRELAKFQQAVFGFHLLSRQMSNLVAILFLCGECVVVLLMVIGGSFLFFGFVLAMLLLLIFCVALASVLARRLQAACNCFGSSEKPITFVDIWRNVGLLVCAGGGCDAWIWTRGTQESLGGGAWLLMVMVAGVFVMLWIQLGEIVQLFRQG